jgi:hypothetical protein
VFANAAQIGATVLGDSKIDLAARLDAKAVTNRLRDRHSTLARHFTVILQTRNTSETRGIT